MGVAFGVRFRVPFGVRFERRFWVRIGLPFGPLVGLNLGFFLGSILGPSESGQFRIRSPAICNYEAKRSENKKNLKKGVLGGGAIRRPKGTPSGVRFGLIFGLQFGSPIEV